MVDQNTLHTELDTDTVAPLPSWQLNTQIDSVSGGNPFSAAKKNVQFKISSDLGDECVAAASGDIVKGTANVVDLFVGLRNIDFFLFFS
jgi:hypothetical protein